MAAQSFSSCHQQISAADHGQYRAAVNRDEAQSATTLALLAASWHTADDLADLTRRITHATLAAVVGANAVGMIRTVHGRHLSCDAPTDDTAAELDRLQVDGRQGPSITAMDTGLPVVTDEQATKARWPTLSERATERGVASIACVPMRTAERILGVLTLYSGAPAAFTEATALTTAIATHAALALRTSAQRNNLERAVASRDRIGQAKGILMVRHRWTAERAFHQLVIASQAANLKLVDVADWLIDEQTASHPADCW